MVWINRLRTYGLVVEEMKLCDKCGKEIKDDFPEEIWGNIEEIFGNVKFEICGKFYDLCEECNKKLKEYIAKWFKKKK